ncbi:MAG: type II toxin-antitoxin system RelE/ParE family toxin [Verrucomicrobiota bacterium]
MRFKLAFHPLVRIDLVEASTWYELREPGKGQQLETEAHDVFRRFPDAALFYAVRFEDVRRANLRTFPHGIFYFIHSETVVVLGILHGARDSEEELQRRRETYG